MANFFLICIGFLSTLRGYKFFLSLTPNSWQSTDWMISYETGPVRRGLSGTILKIFLQNFPEIDINIITFILTLLAIWLIVYLICIQRSLKNTFAKFAIVSSPLFYPLFFFNDPQGGGRKEVLALIFICILSFLKYYFPIINSKLIYPIWTIAFPLLVLCHEGIFFFLAPYLFFTIFILDSISNKNSSLFFYRKIIIKYIKLILPGLIALLFSLFYKNLPLSNVQLICDSWQKLYHELDCLNVRASLSQIVYYGYNNSFVIYQKFNIYIQWLLAFIYLSLILITCLVPLITSGKFKNQIEQKINVSFVLFIFSFIVFIFNLPLYILAVDYGRWISTSFSILILFCISYQNNINHLVNKVEFFKDMPFQIKYYLSLLVRNTLQNKLITVILSVLFVFIKTPHWTEFTRKFFVLSPFYENFL